MRKKVRKMEEIKVLDLMEQFANSSINTLEFSCSDFSLKLSKGAVAAAPVVMSQPAVAAPVITPQAETVAAEPEKAEYITAPLVGTFYQAPSPEAQPFVKVGQKVTKGQTVCILEAMKMFSEVPAPFDCVIEECLVNDGAQVGYDAPLFKVKKG